nr:hypothetical protein [Tanacetum cinerariifolium]
MKSDEFIKSSFEDLVSIPSESKGIPDNMCDVPFYDNSLPLDTSKYQFEDSSDSNDDSTLIDDDYFSIDNIEYVEASPTDSELVSLEETNTFDNSLPESKTFCFDSKENGSGSTTTRAGISLPDYKAFYDDHVKEISSGSTTTHSDFSLYDLFIFDLSINPFPPADRSDFYEFADELAHIISPPDESLFAYVVWIFLPFLSYSVAPQYLLSFENEDTFFDPGIFSYHISSFMPDASHRSGTYPKHLNGSLMEILFPTCSPMDQ